jgi:DNA modification methylase
MTQITIGNATLYLGDCREIAPTLPAVDAIVTDPPYGLGDKWQGGGGGSKRSSWRFDPKEAMAWDRDLIDIAPMLSKAENAIVWGGHLYPLPPRRGWLLWDKKQSGSWTTGHAELAWTTIDQPIRAYRMSQVEAHKGMHKEHPTQKPLKLMEWCLTFLPDAGTILDPFMGSGTTGVACMNLGRRFIGIEIDPAYFEIARERVTAAHAQQRLFA